MDGGRGQPIGPDARARPLVRWTHPGDDERYPMTVTVGYLDDCRWWVYVKIGRAAGPGYGLAYPDKATAWLVAQRWLRTREGWQPMEQAHPPPPPTDPQDEPY